MIIPNDKTVVKISLLPEDTKMEQYFSKVYFQNYTFEVNNNNCIDCDFWIIFGQLPNKVESVNVSPHNIFLLTNEFDGGYNMKFLKQFEKVFTADPRLQGQNIEYFHLGNPWFINDSFDNLYNKNQINKTKLISIVTSSLSNISYSRNYKIRYDFVIALKKHFGENIDVFGRGFNEIKNKDEGLLPYKFSIAIENMPLPYNISEKISDCFLTHTFPFYYDCPNIYRFYDDNSYKKIDIMDHAYSIDTIEEIISNDLFYNHHLKYIIEAKKKYLLNYSFNAVIVNIIEKFGNRKLDKSWINLSRNNKYQSQIKIKLINLIYNWFK